MARKRRSGGRSQSGSTGSVQCSLCGRMVPGDKAIKKSRYTSIVSYKLGKELRDSGTIMPRRQEIQILCISCSIHRGVRKIRSKSDRK
ncbi:MAG: 30S ribosomal protein S26e [Candidatus Kariarchaeaceae archaeon]